MMMMMYVHNGVSEDINCVRSPHTRGRIYVYTIYIGVFRNLKKGCLGGTFQVYNCKCSKFSIVFTAQCT